MVRDCSWDVQIVVRVGECSKVYVDPLHCINSRVNDQLTDVGVWVYISARGCVLL